MPIEGVLGRPNSLKTVTTKLLWKREGWMPRDNWVEVRTSQIDCVGTGSDGSANDPTARLSQTDDPKLSTEARCGPTSHGNLPFCTQILVDVGHPAGDAGPG